MSPLVQLWLVAGVEQKQKGVDHHHGIKWLLQYCRASCADVEDIALTIHPHPTVSESVMLAAEVCEGTVTELFIPKKKILVIRN